MKVAVVGAGLSGLCMARLFKDDGHQVTVFEKTDKIGGACQDYWDKKGQCWVSKCGPHLLHFRKETRVAESFLISHTDLASYDHQVMALGNGGFTMWPPTNAHHFLHDILNPKVSFFDEYISSYSNKMWGKHWTNIKDKVLKRFKTKKHYNTDFFEGQNVYIPKNGYTNLFKDLAKGLNIKFNHTGKIENEDYDLVIWTAPIDEAYDLELGELDWQGIDFTFETIKTSGEDLLPTPVVNLNTHPKFTRMTEYNQLNVPPKCNGINRIIGFEVSAKNNKLYPINDKKNSDLLKKYQRMSKLKSFNVYFHGRLGEYKYYDMDQIIQASIDLFNNIKGDAL